MLKQIAQRIATVDGEVEAHCDGPCGVYDPASARIAAEAVLSITRERESFRFKDVPSRPVLSVLRGFSAPVRVETTTRRTSSTFSWSTTTIRSRAGRPARDWPLIFCSRACARFRVAGNP